MVNFNLATLTDLEKPWNQEKEAIQAIKDQETTNWFMQY